MRPQSGGGIDWGLIYRACEQRLRMRKWEIRRYTLSQLINALTRADGDGAGGGGFPIGSLAELDRLWEEEHG